MFTPYVSTYGVTKVDLGAVAVTLRSNTARNENSTMRRPLSIEDYLARRYIVRPIRLLDMCLLNGAACVIVTRVKSKMHYMYVCGSARSSPLCRARYPVSSDWRRGPLRRRRRIIDLPHQPARGIWLCRSEPGPRLLKGRPHRATGAPSRPTPAAASSLRRTCRDGTYGRSRPPAAPRRRFSPGGRCESVVILLRHHRFSPCTHLHPRHVKWLSAG